MVPYDRNTGYQPRNPEVLRVNPKQQVPVLIDGEVEIFDSTRYSNIWRTYSRHRRCGPASQRPGPPHVCLR